MMNEGLIGGPFPCEDLRYPEEMARFAVDQHNEKQQNSDLEFVKLVKSKVGYVAGTIFYLTIEAKDSDSEEMKTYQVEVFEKPWGKTVKEVQKFVQVDDLEQTQGP